MDKRKLLRGTRTDGADSQGSPQGAPAPGRLPQGQINPGNGGRSAKRQCTRLLLAYLFKKRIHLFVAFQPLQFVFV